MEVRILSGLYFLSERAQPLRSFFIHSAGSSNGMAAAMLFSRRALLLRRIDRQHGFELFIL